MLSSFNLSDVDHVSVGDDDRHRCFNLTSTVTTNEIHRPQKSHVQLSQTSINMTSMVRCAMYFQFNYHSITNAMKDFLNSHALNFLLLFIHLLLYLFFRLLRKYKQEIITLIVVYIFVNKLYLYNN